jgi:ligand-binding sensor domain-containing protein/two-component sensor histidine kinase
MRRGLIEWFFLLYIGLPAGAQPTRAIPCRTNYLSRNLDNTNGLVSNNVQAITQDKAGYIWIGTDKGLQRYDGLRFLNCFGPGTAPQSLTVPALFPDDANGRMLYELTGSGWMQWDYLHHEPAPFTPGPTKETTYTDEKGAAWKIGIAHEDKTKPDAQGLAWITEPGKIKAEGRYLTEKDSGRTWLVIEPEGLLLLDEKNKKILPNPFHLDPSTIRAVTADSHGNLWINSWTHLFYRYVRATGQLYRYSLADILKQEGNESTLPVWISSILEDDQGTLWLGTGQAGLLKYDYLADKFEYILRDPGNSLALQYTDQVNTLFQDKEKNIWIGTDKGISILNPYRQYFITLSNQDTAQPAKVVSDIIPVALIHGDLWVGSWGGGIKVYDSAWHFKKQFFFPGQYDHNMVWCFLEQPDGSVWVGCQAGVIYKIDPQGRIRETLVPAETEHRTIKSMVKDRDGNILLGLQSGKIIVYDQQTKCFLPYNGDNAPLTPIENLFVDKEGACWASTGRGLGEYDPKERKIKAFYLPHGNINIRIVGTENDGAYLFSKKTHLFTRLPINDDQPHWSAHAVTSDSEGNIWFTTDHAIGHFNPVTGESYISQPARGLTGSDFLACRFLPSPDGKWITWTSTEVVGFYPDLLNLVGQRTGKVAITGFRVLGTPVYIDSLLLHQQPVKLDYKQNFLSIDFSSLQFSGIDRVRYYYQLEGVDANWVYGGARGNASYTNLPPGDYTFKVRAGSASKEVGTASFAISIAAPFWSTPWFRFILLGLAALLIFWLIRRHDRNMRKETNMKEQIAKTEMMALRAQMNPHFIFNCINSIDALIQSDDKYHATMYLNKFARLIRNILDSSKHETISLARDLETLQLYIDMEKFRNEDRFIAEIRVDPELLEEDCRVPPLIVQPYVENAIVHGLRNRPGKNGRLIIEVRKEKEVLVYRIEDNGIGRLAAATGASRHTSYGLEMSRERVNLFNREDDIPVIITDLHEDDRPTGTRVQVSLKLN